MTRAHTDEETPPPLEPFLKRNWKLIRASLVFAGTLGIWLAWYPVLVKTDAMAGLLELNADLTALMLRWLGVAITVEGTLVSSSVFAMRIGHECTSVVPMVLLICAAIAYPSQIRQKLLCVALGLPILFLLNLARTVSLYYVGVHIPDYFDMLHYVVWQSIMILAVVAIWLYWAGRLVNVRTT